MLRCPKCGRVGNTQTERRPNGNSTCHNCGHTGPTTEFIRKVVEETQDNVCRKLFVPFYNSDSTEGRGPMVPEKFGFLSKDEAWRYANGQPGIMGRPGPWDKNRSGDWEVREFDILGSADQATAAKDRQTKEKALNKLSAEERRVLGLA